MKVTRQKTMGKRIVQLIASRHFANNPVGLIGVPLANGQPQGGVDGGPKALRDGGLIKRLQRNNRNISDLGDIDIRKFRNGVSLYWDFIRSK